MSSVLQSLQYSFHLVNGIGFTQMEMLRFTLKFVFSLMDPVVWSDCLESEFGTSTVWYQQFNLCYVQYGWFSGLLLCLSPCDACLTNRGGGTGLANPWSAVKSSLLKVPNLGLVSSGCLNPMDGWGRLPGSCCSPCPFWLPSTSFFHSMLNSEGGRCCLSLCSLKIFPALGLKLSTVVVASISESLLSPTVNWKQNKDFSCEMFLFQEYSYNSNWAATAIVRRLTVFLKFIALRLGPAPNTLRFDLQTSLSSKQWHLEISHCQRVLLFLSWHFPKLFRSDRTWNKWSTPYPLWATWGLVPSGVQARQMSFSYPHIQA